MALNENVQPISLNNTHKQDENTFENLQKKKPNEIEQAVLEIYALCLGQGFVGMYYDQPKIIQSYLERIGHLVPSVKLTEKPFFERHEIKGKSEQVQHRVHGLFKRFDMLDYALWIVPIIILLMMYGVLNSHLSQILKQVLGAS